MKLLANLDLPLKVLLLLVLVVGTHVLVIAIRRLGGWLTATQTKPSLLKLKSIASLATSGLVFTLYFVAGGLILREFGVSLTAYLASASIIGLAVGFGSQGVVQDVVTGLTLIFSDLFDIGEMVEISGQSGIVKTVGMRFVQLENSYGASIFIPNRTITNVINYPRGYIRCIADITLPENGTRAAEIEERVATIVGGIQEQFPGILRRDTSVEGRVRTKTGKEFLRVKFRIWPGRGDPIEKTFKEEVCEALRAFDPDYPPWRVAIYYEVEKKIAVGRR